MPGKKNWLDLFYDWMIRTGKKPGKREIPSEPLAPLGAKSKLGQIRRILIDLNYIHVKRIKAKYKYSVWPYKKCKRIDYILPEEIIDWVNNKFPTCKDRKAKQRKSSYVFAAWKFGEYLVFEMKNSNGKPIWKKEQLNQLKERAYPPTIKEFEIEILPLSLIDGFIDFLKTKHLKFYTMIYLSRWLGGMRYQEVINAKTDFRSGTLIIKSFETNIVTIWGKGEGGLQKDRQSTLLPQVKKVLKEYLEYREKEITKKSLKDDPGYLFLNQSGNRYSENSGHLNENLRRYARAWGKIKKEDLKLVSTHKLGRHGFGTYFYPLMPEKLLMKEMGLEDSKTLHRYANIAKTQRAYIMKQAANKGNHVEQPSKEDTEHEDGAFMEFIQKIRASKNLSREEKAKVIAELI